MQTDGLVHFSRFVEGLQAPDYSTIDRKVNRLQIDPEKSLVRLNNPVSITADSSGVKVHNTGDWIRKVWKVKNRYLKMRFAVDIRTGQVVLMDVSSEKMGDGKRLRRLGQRVSRSFENMLRKYILDSGLDTPNRSTDENRYCRPWKNGHTSCEHTQCTGRMFGYSHMRKGKTCFGVCKEDPPAHYFLLGR
jgi:hypothetical protein